MVIACAVCERADLMTALPAFISCYFRSCALCYSFWLLLQRYVDYYQVIEDPIDLRMIAQKIQCDGYNCLEDMHKDLLLMLQNARTFNKPNSTIYKVSSSSFCQIVSIDSVVM